MKKNCILLTNNFKNNDFNLFSSKSVLITGGAGFLGSWMCEYMLDNNAKVFCLDDLSTGLIDNIKGIKNRKNFIFLKKDVTKNFKINEKIDYIFHMASRPGPEDYIQYPLKTLDANSIGTNKVLELARKNDSILLFASTSEVYGDAKIIPTSENYWGYVNPIGVRSCYDEGKRFSEALLMAYYRQYGLDTKIVRIFNTYGPRIRSDGSYGRALSRFVHQALQNKDITIYGDGLQTRSFCYVTDTVNAIFKCALNKKTTATPINIGNPNEITIKKLAALIIKKTNSKSKMIFLKRPEDDPQRRCPNINKAKKILNWKPEIILDDGLDKIISWMRQRI